MTTPRVTSRRTALEKHREEVIALLLTGSKPVEIATKYKVSRSSLTKFMVRHVDKLTALRTEIQKRSEDYLVADKVARIAAKDQRWALLEQVRRERAAGGTGLESGLVVKTYKMVGSGKNAVMVEEYKIDPGLLDGFDRIERGAAEELGQIPKADQNVNLRAQVLIRDYGQIEPE